MFRGHFVFFFTVILICFNACVQAQQAPVVQALPIQTAGDSVPHLIRFSGSLKDVSGNPRNGVVGVTFALHKYQEGGAPLWSETQNVQADSTGHYTVSLGATQASGLSADVFAYGDARWLGVQPEGQAEQPRMLLLSVPYALKALDAKTLGGKPLSAFQLVPPPAQKNSMANASTQAEQPNEISCSGATACKKSFIPQFSSNGGSATVSDSIITQRGTTIGIAGSESVSGNVSATGSVSGAIAAFSSNTATPVLNVTQTGTGGESGVAMFQVEEDKPAKERGHYLHPELFEEPETARIGHVAPMSDLKPRPNGEETPLQHGLAPRLMGNANARPAAASIAPMPILLPSLKTTQPAAVLHISPK